MTSGTALDCGHVTDDALLDQAEGRRGPIDADRIHAHLAGCTACGARLREIRRFKRLVRRIDTPSLPRSLDRRTRSALEIEQMLAGGGLQMPDDDDADDPEGGGRAPGTLPLADAEVLEWTHRPLPRPLVWGVILAWVLIALLLGRQWVEARLQMITDDAARPVDTGAASGEAAGDPADAAAPGPAREAGEAGATDGADAPHGD